MYDTCNNTLVRVNVTSVLCFLLEILSISKAIKSNFKGSYDIQNLTLVVISYEFYEFRRKILTFHFLLLADECFTHESVLYT